MKVLVFYQIRVFSGEEIFQKSKEIITPILYF